MENTVQAICQVFWRKSVLFYPFPGELLSILSRQLERPFGKGRIDPLQLFELSALR